MKMVEIRQSLTSEFGSSVYLSEYVFQNTCDIGELTAQTALMAPL